MDLDLEKAVVWAERNQTNILLNGRPLNSKELQIATAAGISEPDKVRILLVETIPTPDEDIDPELYALWNTFMPNNPDGLTLHYGIFIRNGYENIISHELRHVSQYEMYGSIGDFLKVYINQVIT